jgi:hypothetical protein
MPRFKTKQQLRKLGKMTRISECMSEQSFRVIFAVVRPKLSGFCVCKKETRQKYKLDIDITEMTDIFLVRRSRRFDPFFPFVNAFYMGFFFFKKNIYINMLFIKQSVGMIVCTFQKLLNKSSR